MMIAISLAFQGRTAEARQVAEEVYRTSAFDALNTGLLAGLLARAGERDRANEVLIAMTGAIAIGRTIYHLECGEIDAAIGWYQKDIEERRPNAPMVAYAAWLKPLRDHPRWPAVACMMNLP